MTLASILATSTVAMGTPSASLLGPSDPRGPREFPSTLMRLSSQFSLIILTHVSLMSVMVTLTALRRCFAHWRPIIPDGQERNTRQTHDEGLMLECGSSSRSSGELMQTVHLDFMLVTELSDITLHVCKNMLWINFEAMLPLAWFLKAEDEFTLLQ